jgi:hypothetical protein
LCGNTREGRGIQPGEEVGGSLLQAGGVRVRDRERRPGRLRQQPLEEATRPLGERLEVAGHGSQAIGQLGVVEYVHRVRRVLFRTAGTTARIASATGVGTPPCQPTVMNGRAGASRSRIPGTRVRRMWSAAG